MKTKRKTTRLAAVVTACVMALTLMLSYLPGITPTAMAATYNSLTEMFGLSDTAVLGELTAHQNDGYYLGTPYIYNNYSNPAANMSPNGNPNASGSGMNCAGFPAYVFQKVGADLSAIAGAGYQGGVINAANWHQALVRNELVTSYKFNCVAELLASGQAQKGDLIFCNPVAWESGNVQPGTDCHLGFFWGDSPADNKFWHSDDNGGNRISEIVPRTEPSYYYLIKTGGRLAQPFDPFAIVLQKTDADTATEAPQGNAGQAGAQFTMNFYEDAYYSAPEELAGLAPTRSWIFETDVTGFIDFDTIHFVSGDAFYIDPNDPLGEPGLPPGTVTVQETLAPAGYLLNDTLYMQQITADDLGEVVLHYNAPVVPEQVIRGGVRIEKWDIETNANAPQGGAALENTALDIYNRSAASVWVNGTEYAPGAVVATIQTNAAGVAETGNDLLPYGDYEVIETAPPTGYLATGVLSRTFSIIDNGVVVDLNTDSTAVKNNPIRGDIEFTKRAEDMQTMSNILFSITSKTTGESHEFVTDESGYWSSHSSWNPHSQDTNEGQTSYDDIWFGDINALDDSKGALLYDTYIIEELPCAGNEGMVLVSFEVTVRRDMQTINLGTILNEYDQTPKIGTTAIDEDSGTHSATPGETTTIIDTVQYWGLTVGQEYTVEGVLMDKATGAPLLVDGAEVTASATFTPNDPDGTVDVTFTFDSSALAGTTTVVFETLYHEGREVTAHTDINDMGQTVTFNPTPELGTRAIDASSGTHHADAREETTFIDSIGYIGLTPGEEYTVRGVLMDKSGGTPLLVDGKEVTGSTTFTAQSADGTIDVVFTFNSTGLKGTTTVIFEKLYHNDIEIAAHADLEAINQTITFKAPPPPEKKTGTKTFPKTGITNGFFSLWD